MDRILGQILYLWCLLMVLSLGRSSEIGSKCAETRVETNSDIVLMVDRTGTNQGNRHGIRDLRQYTIGGTGLNHTQRRKR